LLYFRWNFSIARHCSDAPRRDQPRRPGTRSTIYKAPIPRDEIYDLQGIFSVFSAQRSTPVAAGCGSRQLPIMSSIHDPNEISDLPAHVLPAR
jgi:hypothetical protein